MSDIFKSMCDDLREHGITGTITIISIGDCDVLLSVYENYNVSPDFILGHTMKDTNDNAPAQA